jgi:CBS domain containing-hemolysin-like protein
MTPLWTDAAHIFAVVLLVGLNALFVAAEFALVSVRKTRIDELANEGNRAARRVRRALARLDVCIAGTQLGVTMAALGLGSVGESAVASLLQPLLDPLLPGKAAFFTAHAVALALAFVVVTAVDIVLGELIPKSIALQRADRTILSLIGPLDLFIRIFRPFIAVLNWLASTILKAASLHPVTEKSSIHSVEELELLVHSTREAGLLEAQQERMVAGVFDFEETMVRKLMTPRLDIVSIEAGQRVRELVRLAAESGHSRLPVHDGNLDNTVGIVHVKDALPALMTGSLDAGVREFMRPVYFIPENKRAGFLLAEMRRRRIQMAVVRDEYGTVTGVVTVEDLVEEIVGDIQDEHDAEEPQIIEVDPLTTIVDGKITIDDVNERLGLDLPLEDADTIGGFVFAHVGHQAARGERTVWNHLALIVEATDGRRITQVRIVRDPASLKPTNNTDTDENAESDTNGSQAV